MKFRNKLLFIVIVVVIGIIIFLEQTPSPVSTDTGITTGLKTEQPQVLEIGKPAPDFILLDYKGNEHSLEDYKGKYVILNLWASWCPFCIEEMPLFQDLYDEYNHEGLEIIAINRAEPLETAKSYSDNLNLTYTILLNPTDDIAKAYRLRAMPTTYFIDKEGNLLDIKHGALTEEMLFAKNNSLFGFGEPMEEEIIPEILALSSEREIKETDGVKHSVPLNDIRGGGPPKDGIPSIDNPKFVSVDEANDYLDDEGLGISVMFGAKDRFYPFQIIVWHEIVNDIVGSQPVLVTYCPLCGTGIVFDPTVNGERTEFGTSGKLWNSNLVMYDRQTDSYWSQVLGESIVGEMTGTKLAVLPHDVISWKDWKNTNPDGEVLSKSTGHFRDYSRSPYGDYDINREIYFPVDKEDERYHPKEPTFTIEINGDIKIYPQSELEKADSPFTDNLGRVELEITYNKDDKTIDIKRLDTNETIIPTYGFWFSVIAVHPDADIYTN